MEGIGREMRHYWKKMEEPNLLREAGQVIVQVQEGQYICYTSASQGYKLQASNYELQGNSICTKTEKNVCIK